LEVGACARVMLNTTSSAPKAWPSWNFTPSRSQKRQRFGSTCSHRVARPGARPSSCVRLISVS
jgi:hypothetical protein